MSVYYHSPDLPWTIQEEDEARFRRIRRRVALLLLLLALLIPFLPLPTVEREEVEELPPRLAKLLMERQQARPAEPIPVPPKPEVEKLKPEPKPKQVEQQQARKTQEQARDKAARSGLLAFKDDLAALRDDPSVSSVSKATQLNRGATTQGKTPERSLITAGVAAGSSGISTSKLSRDTGGQGLAGRATTQVGSPIGGSENSSGTVARGRSGKASRSIEEIQLVFDKNKSAIYALYTRALREDPSLQGKVVLKLTIAPSGQVTACSVVSSELGAADMERKLVARVMQFDFGAKDVDTMVVTYPIDFLPS